MWPELTDKFFRDDTRSKLREVPVVDEVRISCGRYCSFINVMADIAAGKCVLLANLERVAASAIQLFKLIRAPRKVGVKFSLIGMYDHRHLPGVALRLMTYTVEEQPKRS